MHNVCRLETYLFHHVQQIIVVSLCFSKLENGNEEKSNKVVAMADVPLRFCAIHLREINERASYQADARHTFN